MPTANSMASNSIPQGDPPFTPSIAAGTLEISVAAAALPYLAFPAIQYTRHYTDTHEYMISSRSRSSGGGSSSYTALAALS